MAAPLFFPALIVPVTLMSSDSAPFWPWSDSLPPFNAPGPAPLLPAEDGHRARAGFFITCHGVCSVFGVVPC